MEMNENEKQKLINHIAGQTIVHKNPFDHLETPKNHKQIDQNFRNKFIIPIYMNLLGISQYEEKLKTETEKIIHKVDKNVVSQMLGDFNWRTRSTGAFFSAIKDYVDFQDSIGILLLKSEVTYAGESYCLAMAEFNNTKSIKLLNEYLDYYLTKPELWFDQDQAIGAIAYLDKVNKTNELEKHKSKWTEFVVNKPNWDLNKSIEWFEKNLNCLKEIKKYVS